ncbi:mechanosensitive ion channel family protein [Aliterella atlantica]|uniref:Mechanosensitive ion channel protein MscS n=1 Tax=Aliterella atlantica CENA595 TaxID=1618023 RepID=A0A0D8ZMN5_9CYAN|nr:mechanosensitive ion channel domain-containing protein [Aliterella atlantica]KJH69694.1 mechanosensitive ion channel protein MscS [Aliterella atlantica CENA595]
MEQIFNFISINTEIGLKVLFTIAFLLVLWLLRRVANAFIRESIRNRYNGQIWFWAGQGLNLLTAVLLILGLLEIWFDNPNRLATAIGLVTAGIAFALQKVIAAIAGYFVILRSNIFSVGDRITMGGVRGDVIALGFIHTKIMEMGQPVSIQDSSSPSWVKSRQFTGRIVTVTNDRIFEEPVYNYTQDFPYLWEEISIPISYSADRQVAEQILLDCAARHTENINQMSQESLRVMRDRYFLHAADLTPKVYYRITNNWLELTVRFVVREHGIRDLKDTVSRDLLKAFDAAGINIATTTYNIVGLPPLQIDNIKENFQH